MALQSASNDTDTVHACRDTHFKVYINILVDLRCFKAIKITCSMVEAYFIFNAQSNISLFTMTSQVDEIVTISLLRFTTLCFLFLFYTHTLHFRIRIYIVLKNLWPRFSPDPNDNGAMRLEMFLGPFPLKIKPFIFHPNELVKNKQALFI